MNMKNDSAVRDPASCDSAASVPPVCQSCGNRLPLRFVTAEEGARTTWLCTRCNHRHRGCLDPEAATDELMANVRLVDLECDHTQMVLDEDVLAEIVEGLIPGAFVDSERRGFARIPLSCTIPAMCVDDDLEPIGEPFLVNTRDLSDEGIALLHHEPIDDKYLLLELPAREGIPPTPVVLEVLRCRHTGSAYEIGGRFLTR